MFQVLSYNWTEVSRPGSCCFWTLLSSEPLEKGKFQSQRDLHFSPKFKDSSFNNSNVFIFDLNQQDGFIYMGPTTWISAARHPAVNHLGGKKRTIKPKFHRESCNIKVAADNPRPLQGNRSNNRSAILTLLLIFQ